MQDKKPPVVVLDTDIGPDCDDAGALVMLLNMERAGLCRLAAVTHCTSNPFGAGCIDAICKFYGRPDMEIGTLKRGGLLDGQESRRYNEAVAREFENRYSGGEEAKDAVGVLRRVIANEPEVTLIAIGPLSNVGALVGSPGDGISPLDGASLLREKGTKLVSMGGGKGGPEFNFYTDVGATKTVCENWPGEIVFSIFETGVDVITGKNLQKKLKLPNPLARAYELYAPDGRSSWDQTAAFFAVFPETKLFRQSRSGKMSVLDDGKSVWSDTGDARHTYIEKAAPAEEIAGIIDSWMEREV